MLKNIIARLKLIKQPRSPKWFLITAAILMVAILVKPKSESIEKTSPVRPLSADTYIPGGFVLVPVQLVNQASIDSLIGSFTIVDIYLAGEQLEKTRKLVAQDVRMIRAPLDPNQFGVLMDENNQEMIEKLSQPIFAVLKNPNSQKNMSTVKSSQRRISYGD